MQQDLKTAYEWSIIDGVVLLEATRKGSTPVRLHSKTPISYKQWNRMIEDADAIRLVPK